MERGVINQLEIWLQAMKGRDFKVNHNKIRSVMLLDLSRQDFRFIIRNRQYDIFISIISGSNDRPYIAFFFSIIIKNS